MDTDETVKKHDPETEPREPVAGTSPTAKVKPKSGRRGLKASESGATVFLALMTAALAVVSYFQVEASREVIQQQYASLRQQEVSLKQQNSAIERMDKALADLGRALEIAQADRATFASISRSAREESANSRAALVESPELVSVDGNCQIEKTASVERFTLLSPTNCDYVRVILRNRGKSPIQAHAELYFLDLKLPCPSAILTIPPHRDLAFAVHVDRCLAGKPAGTESVSLLQVHGSAELDSAR